MYDVMYVLYDFMIVHSERERFRGKDDTLQKQLQTLRSDIDRLNRIVDTVDALIKQDWPKKYVFKFICYQYILSAYISTCSFL
jgi:hypothetical protein